MLNLYKLDIDVTKRIWVVDEDGTEHLITLAELAALVGASGSYTPHGPTTATVGGIPAGTDLGTVAMSQQDLNDMELYPPTGPTTDIDTTPNGGVYEKGDAQASIDLSSNITQGTDPFTLFTFSKTGAGVIFTDASPVAGTENYTDATGWTALSNITYTATVTDGTFSDTASITFTATFAYYWGVGAPGLNVTADGGGLTKLVQVNTATIAEVFNTTNQVFYWVQPMSYPALTSILDTNGFETITDWTVHTNVMVTNSFGVTVACRVYEFNNLNTNSSFTNTFKQ